jgi:hypothetical protein
MTLVWHRLSDEEIDSRKDSAGTVSEHSGSGNGHSGFDHLWKSGSEPTALSDRKLSVYTFKHRKAIKTNSEKPSSQGVTHGFEKP